MQEGGDLIGRLSPALRAVVLGLAVGGVRGVDPLDGAARIAGPEGEACRSALRALDALPREARARCLAALARAAIEPVPAGIERVHPGWLRAALAGEATPILLAVTAGLPAVVVAVAAEIADGRAEAPALRAPAAVPPGPLAELRRALFARFVAMPDPPLGPRAGEPPPSWWRVLAALPADALAAEIARRGGETLGVSLQGAGPEVAARTAAGLGAAAARALRAAAAGPAVTAVERERARAFVVAAAAAMEMEVEDGARPAEPAEGVGVEVVAEALAGEPDEAGRVLAQRLSPALGRMLLRVRDRRRLSA
jgi:hypothetical protein